MFWDLVILSLNLGMAKPQNDLHFKTVNIYGSKHFWFYTGVISCWIWTFDVSIFIWHKIEAYGVGIHVYLKCDLTSSNMSIYTFIHHVILHCLSLPLTQLVRYLRWVWDRAWHWRQAPSRHGSCCACVPLHHLEQHTLYLPFHSAHLQKYHFLYQFQAFTYMQV